MSAARVVCACCGRRAVWVVSWDADEERGGPAGGRWMLADDAVTSPWLRSGHTVHVVDPVRAS